MATQSKGFQAFSTYFAAAHNKVTKKLGRTVEKFLDPATLGLLFTFLTGAFKSCFRQDGEEATIQRLKQNGGLNTGKCYHALLRSGYEEDSSPRERRRICREMAHELTAGTGKVSAEDLESFLNDVRETPTPAPVEDPEGGGFWSIGWVVLALCLFSSGTAQAEGFWDAEGDVKAIKAGVTTLGDRVASLELSQRRTQILVEKLANHLLPESQECVVPAPPPEPATVVIKSTSERMDALSEAMGKAARDLKEIRENNSAKPAPARSVSSGVTLNGRSIGDVAAYIRSNPAGHVDVNGSLVLHLQQHGFGGSLNSLTRTQQQKLHDIAHSKGYPAKTIYHTSASRATPLPMASGCANGQCSRQASARGTRTGPIRWLMGL